MRSWLLLLLVACSAQNGSADGREVFQSVCATCHGERGTPTEVMVTRMNVRDLNAPEFRSKLTPALVELQVRKGSKNKLMPAFEGAISDAQIKAVSAYVASPQFPAR